MLIAEAPTRSASGPLRRRIVRRLRATYAFPLLAAILLLHLILALLAFDPTPFTGGGNAGYVALARSLLDHGAYVDLYDPARPPHTQYPPVFPAVIAAALAAGITPWVGLKLLVVGFSLAAVGFTFLWLRRRGWPGAAPWVALIVAVSPGVLEQSHWVLSDVPFWAFTMAALWAFERLRPDDWGRFAIAIAATTLAYFTRSAGLPLVLAALAWLALRRRWRQLALFALIIGPLATLWWLRARSLGGIDYVEQFMMVNPYVPELGRIGPRDFLERVIENDRRYIGIHLPALLLGLEGRLLLPLSGAVLILAAVGWGARLRRPGVPELFLPLYVGLLLSWPHVWSGERFLLPVLPLILSYAGIGLSRACHRFVPRLSRVAGPAGALLVLAAAAPGVHAKVVTGIACTRLFAEGERYPCVGADWRDYFELAEWSRRALPDGAVVLSRKPRLFYLLSGHPGRVYPFSEDPDTFFAAARDAGARYVVLDHLDQLSPLYLVPALVERASAFCTMRSLGPTRAVLFGIVADSASAATPRSESEDEAVVAYPSCPEEYWRDGRPPADAEDVPGPP